ncbi:hypothetical protein P175DRAFT_0432189, partial [Aspergillus ochraceoroseus IBT 24754]
YIDILEKILTLVIKGVLLVYRTILIVTLFRDTSLLSIIVALEKACLHFILYF